MNSASRIADEILALFAMRGASAYFGESVSMIEHSLQTAYFANAAAAPAALVIAALLHDVGHLLGEAADDLAEWRHDARHQETGGRWLALRFPAEIAEPVRLHVAAKRYLCGIDPQYFARLSAASVATLELQGGAMTATEIVHFETQRFYRQAVAVRQWDDRAKIVGLRTPGVADYGALVEQYAKPEHLKPTYSDM